MSVFFLLSFLRIAAEDHQSLGSALPGRVILVRCGVFAARVVGTDVEFAVFALTESQSTSAFGTDAVGDGDVLFDFIVTINQRVRCR